MSWTIVGAKKNNGGGRSPVDYGIRVARHGSGKTERLALVISKSMLRRLKWKQGDRVHFLIDNEMGLAGLQRTTDLSGRTITNNTGTRTKSSPHGMVKIHLEKKVMDKCVNGQPRLFDQDECIIDDESDIVAFKLLTKSVY